MNSQDLSELCITEETKTESYWYDDRMWMRCGACGTAFDTEIAYMRKDPVFGWPDCNVPYCPECGAKMLGWSDLTWDEYKEL